MSDTQTNVTRMLLEKAQLICSCLMLLGGVAYVGKRMAVDESQSLLLQSIAADLAVMKDRNADANASIKVIAERVTQVEKRLERIEAKQ